MTDQTEARFEALLRDVLAEARPSGDAPAELRATVERVPKLARPSLLDARLRRLISGVVGLAAVGVVTIVVAASLAGAPQVPTLPSTPGASAPPTFDPQVRGPGVSGQLDDTLAVFPWVVAVLGWIVLAGLALWVRRRRVLLALPAAAAIGLGVLASSITSIPGVQFGGGVGPTLGLDARAEAQPGSGGPDVWYVTAKPGDPFAFAIMIANPGPLPVTYRGIIEDAPDIVGYYRWTAVWQTKGPSYGMPGAEESIPFQPVELQPGEHLGLYVVARAGPCAYGPAFMIEDARTYGYSIRESITVVVSVLGLTRTSEIALPVRIAEPTSGC